MFLDVKVRLERNQYLMKQRKE